MNILVIAGHPADMFDHCGGTLMHHIQHGDKVTCVSLTQGLRIHDEVISDVFRNHIHEYTEEQIKQLQQDRLKVKYAEVIKACNLFGIEDVRFLDYDDEILTLNAEIISRTAKLIRDVQPQILITHWPYQYGGVENHHALTGKIALAAKTAAASVNFEDRQPAARIAQTFFMLSPHDCSSFSLLGSDQLAHATHYVDVSDVVDLKIKAVEAMASQKYNIPGYARRTVERWAGTFGTRVRVPYAEAFAVEFPEVSNLLPLSDHRLWLATADEHEILSKYSREVIEDPSK